MYTRVWAALRGNGARASCEAASFYLKAVGARLGDGVGGDGRCSCGSGLGAVLVLRFVLGVVLSVVVFILLFFLSQRTQKGEYVVTTPMPWVVSALFR